MIQTPYTDEDLLPDTTYYYALVPNGNPGLTEGRASATTPDLERSAQASFKVLKSNGDEADDTIGGTVQVVLELELENAQAGSEKAVVRLQETGTENEVTHDEDEDHIDLPVNLTQAAGWQQWLDPDGDGPQVASWQTAESKPIGTGKWRWVYSWNTAGAPVSSGQVGTPEYSRLLNHNGEHLISLAEVDGGAGGTLEFGDESADVEDKNVTVGNLVIKSISTSNGTQDYFKFKAGSTDNSLAHPSVTFEIEDEGDPHRYEWWLWVKPTRTNESNFVEFTGIMSSATSKTIVMNEANPQGYSRTKLLDQDGAYTFNLRVKEIRNDSVEGIGEPLVDWWSTGTSFVSHSIHYISDEESEFSIEADYNLSANAQDTRVFDLLPKEFSVKSRELGLLMRPLFGR